MCLSEDSSELCDWSKWIMRVILTNQIPALMNSHLHLADENLARRPPSRHVRRPPSSRPCFHLQLVEAGLPFIIGFLFHVNCVQFPEASLPFLFLRVMLRWKSCLKMIKANKPEPEDATHGKVRF